MRMGPGAGAAGNGSFRSRGRGRSLGAGHEGRACALFHDVTFAVLSLSSGPASTAQIESPAASAAYRAAACRWHSTVCMSNTSACSHLKCVSANSNVPHRLREYENFEALKPGPTSLGVPKPLGS